MEGVRLCVFQAEPREIACVAGRWPDSSNFSRSQRRPRTGPSSDTALLAGCAGFLPLLQHLPPFSLRVTALNDHPPGAPEGRHIQKNKQKPLFV